MQFQAKCARCLHACSGQLDSSATSTGLLNKDHQKAQGCVERNEGRSGTTATATLNYIEQHRPRIFFLENVRNLNNTQGSGAPTDLDHVIARLNSCGYVVYAPLLAPKDYGCPQSRDRYYILGMALSNQAIKQDAEHFTPPPWYLSVVAMLKQLSLPTPYDLRCFWVANDEPIVSELINMRRSQKDAAKNGS